MSQSEFNHLLQTVAGLTPDQLRQLRRTVEGQLAASAPAVEESVFDVMNRAGLIGCIEGAPGSPTDLSTNPVHMQGFGRD